MADVAVAVLRVVTEIRNVAERIKENDRQARRLSDRVTAIEPPVIAVKKGSKMSSSESLHRLLFAVEEIRNFLEGYARTTNFNRALKRKANADSFAKLSVMLTEGMQALQLDIAVDAWATEDASDRLDDLENMMDIMERMESNRTDNHAEVMGVLKALRQDERTELTGWVEIDYDKDLDFGGSTLLGSGGFGEVRTAKWNGADVAVKHLLTGGLQRDCIRSLRKEIRLHSSLHFEFVAALYAASTIAPHLCLVVELASGGSLQHYLYSTTVPLAHALQTAFLYDVARGMSFLHAKGILHRDLKSANVLMFANSRLKLCDFGLSKVKTDLSSRSTHGAVGTTQWMSPEEMDESPANELTDVYSFGVLCFEVATRTEPFKGKRPAQVIGAVLYRNERPQLPQGASASPDVVPLMEHCWKEDPKERPEGFEPVVVTLANVVSRVGDPRHHGATAMRGSSSSGPNVYGDASSVAPSMARLTVGGEGEASGLTDSASQPAGADTGTSADERNALLPALSSSGRVFSALGRKSSRRAAKGTGGEHIFAPSADLPIASEGPLPSTGSSRLKKKLSKMFGQTLSTRGKHEEEELLNERSDQLDLEVAKELHVRAEDLRNQGKYNEAAQLYLRATGIWENILGRDDPLVATALNNRAGLLSSEGKYTEAERLYARAHAIYEKSFGSEHPHVATALNNWALLLSKQGKCWEADPLYLRAIEIGEKALGPDHPDLGTWLNNRAVLLDKQLPAFRRLN
ncbi:unnamed protein product [Ectocarpus sp. CCAP 1310/34]|nr:unnamed protein product [Ectocarpus sp. CCAP 1310/34]